MCGKVGATLIDTVKLSHSVCTARHMNRNRMCESREEGARSLVPLKSRQSSAHCFVLASSPSSVKMGSSSRKRQKQSRPRHIEPLVSIRREDGLWQSIEKDEEELASHLEDHAIVSVNEKSPKAGDGRVPNEDITQRHHQPRDIAIATRTASVPDVVSTPDIKPAKTESSSASYPSPIPPTRADLSARVLNCPLPHPRLPTPVRHIQDIPQAPPRNPVQTPSATRRRRGRPKKSHNAPNWNKPRQVRFSDPVPPEPEPEPKPRDTHVFVRLLKIIVTVENPPPPQRQELVWNNRAKGWRLAGERSERNIADISDLFDDLTKHGSLLRVVLAPTVGRGAREPIEMGWNGGRCCFQGANQDLGTLSIALGEMKDMVKDPWARQFVGYVLI